jgi:CelD/BcsL family acetyltransferase involved in cellulose biosynthesis
MRSAEPATRIETFTSLTALPDDALSLFAASTSFFTSRDWWECVLAHAMPPRARPRLLLVRHGDRPAALFPMLLDPGGGGFRALTTPYSCLYAPLIAREVADRAGVFAAFARHCRAFATTRLDALDAGTAADLAAACGPAGIAVARFDHFGNWHEPVAGLDFASWSRRRPGALRETIRRRTRQAERLAEGRFALFSDPNDIAVGIEAFEAVYARSWKEPEPYPTFNPAQIRAAAALGIARLGIWWIGEVAAAAQFWIVEASGATVLKLAHDEAFKAHSPGTVLTAWMIRHLLEQEHVADLDFGRGDDPYKRDWVTDRRQRVGLLLINPRRPAGIAALARHKIGRLRARLRPAG